MAEVLILSLVLSIDAFSFGIAFGIKGIKIPLKAFSVLSLMGFGTIVFFMLLGRTLSSYLPFCNIAGAFLLIGVGIWICADRRDEHSNIREFLDNPELSDMDLSGTIETPEAIVMGVTLSLDSSAAAMGISMADTASRLMPFTVMTVQLILLILGTLLGKKIKPDINCKYIAVISGLVIVLIGLYQLMPLFG